MAVSPAPAAAGHPSGPPSGLFVVFEGGEGAGKTTQIAVLADRFRSSGHEVVTTREPGGSAVGASIRSLLLDPATGALDDRTEALLYAADRAEHVATVIRPALARGAVVISDRYLDSSLAYQGAGRSLSRDEVASLSSWATQQLVPHLTLVLDIDPEVGLSRFKGADRLEAESIDFHHRVRQAFLDLAAAEPARYAVIDAALPPDDVAARIAQAVDAVLVTEARA
jgi:dTMP kinase